MDSAVLLAMLLVAIAAAVVWSPTLGTRFWVRRRDLAGLPLARRHVIECMRDGVVIANADGTILDVNPAAERILGAPGDEIRSQALRCVLAGLAREPDRSQVQREFDEFHAKLDLTLSPASDRWIREVETEGSRQIAISVALAGPTDRGPKGQFAVLRDRTQERRDERATRQSQKLETVGTLASGLAHEVNNPLAFIRSNLSQISRMGEMVEEQLDDPSNKLADELQELRQIADEALDGIARIEQIVSGMRRFAEGRGDAFVATHINDVVRDAIRLANLHREDGLEVRTRLFEGLPLIDASPRRLVQALLNLLVNSKQALRDTPHAVIDVETEPDGEHIAIRIRDNGPGIPEVLHERIFDPFFTTKDPGQGTGLGLAISYDIVREHGGVLEFRSRQGEGTCFVALLPIEGAA